MLTFARGNLFDFEADAYVNTINCVGVMGKGVALAVRQRYPAIMGPYRAACRVGTIRPGTVWLWETPDGKQIWNAATKDHWWDPSRYAWVTKVLENIALCCRMWKPSRVVMPALGCGNGGLAWDEVRGMVEDALAEVAADVVVLEPQR